MLADLLGILVAFIVASLVTQPQNQSISTPAETTLIALSLPVWILLMKLHGPYDRDGARADH